MGELARGSMNTEKLVKNFSSASYSSVFGSVFKEKHLFFGSSKDQEAAVPNFTNSKKKVARKGSGVGGGGITYQLIGSFHLSLILLRRRRIGRNYLGNIRCVGHALYISKQSGSDLKFEKYFILFTHKW